MDDAESRLHTLLAEARLTDALALLHGAYAEDLSRFIRFLRPATAVEDLCQEVWLAAGRALPRFRFEATLRTWLFAIARRQIAEAARHPSRRKRAPLPSSVDAIEKALLSSPIATRRPTTPSSALRRKRQVAILEEELGRLDQLDRELLELRFVTGLKPSEIVAVLALDHSPNAISQRVVRLLRTLRERLMRRAEFRPT